MPPVFATGPPSPSHPPGFAPLRIGALARRAFSPPPAIAADPNHHAHLRSYLSDLARPYGLTVSDEAIGDDGHSYGEMAAALLEELVCPGLPIGVLVLAFSIPDVRPGRATATYLSQLCPGNPLAFAVCDQGSAAAFTGLRLVSAYLRSGSCQRGLLLVVEQPSLPYRAGLPVVVPDTPVAVGLRCDLTGGAEVSAVRQHRDVPPERVVGQLGEELAATAGHRDTVLIADNYLADALTGSPLASQLRVVTTGQPDTGVWWELADLLPPADGSPVVSRNQRLVLASYEQQLRYLSISTINVAARTEGGSRS